MKNSISLSEKIKVIIMTSEDIVRSLTEIEGHTSDNTRRIEDCEQDIKGLKEQNQALYKMSASIDTLAQGMVSIKEDVKDIKSDQGEMKAEIVELKNVPTTQKAKAFDKVIGIIGSIVATGIIGFVLGQLFPKIFG